MPVSAEQGRGLVERERGWTWTHLEGRLPRLEVRLAAGLLVRARLLPIDGVVQYSIESRQEAVQAEREGAWKVESAHQAADQDERDAASKRRPRGGLTAPGSSAVLEPCRARSPGACWYKVSVEERAVGIAPPPCCIPFRTISGSHAALCHAGGHAMVTTIINATSGCAPCCAPLRLPAHSSRALSIKSLLRIAARPCMLFRSSRYSQHTLELSREGTASPSTSFSSAFSSALSSGDRSNRAAPSILPSAAVRTRCTSQRQASGRRGRRPERTLPRSGEPVPRPAEPRDVHVRQDDPDRDGRVIQRLHVHWQVGRCRSATQPRSETVESAATHQD